MGSIRPLFTITVLVVVGGYLYWKINEGPDHRPGLHRELEQRQDGVPPLAAASGGATLAQDSAAPAWPPVTAPMTAPGTAPPAVNSADSSTKTSAASEAKNGASEVPPIPELPELPATVNATPPALSPANSTPSSDDTGPKFGGLPSLPPNPADATNNTPSFSTPSAAAVTPPSTTTPSPQTLLGSTSGGTPTQPGASNSVISPVAPTQPLIPTGAPFNAAASAALVSPAGPAADDRYGAGGTIPTQSLAITPATSAASATAGATFAASWPAIQAALDRNDLKQAHQLLSKWHGDESLSPAESQKAETLLGQLAGTLIYSTDHQLEPARVVKPGETLESIAKECNVPWQLLAKINGIPGPDQVRPGQELKVVRGPFSAVVDLHRKELTLEVDGRYAGAFAVTVPPGAPVGEGQWLVDQKLEGLQNSFAPSAPSVTNDRTIILRNAASAAATPGGAMLMIASTAAVGPPGAASIRVAPQDAEDLSDILSIGSRIIVRR
jgi:LysM repeat protein